MRGGHRKGTWTLGDSPPYPWQEPLVGTRMRGTRRAAGITRHRPRLRILRQKHVGIYELGSTLGNETARSPPELRMRIDRRGIGLGGRVRGWRNCGRGVGRFPCRINVEGQLVL